VSLVYFEEVLENKILLNVPLVASIPMRFEVDFNAAGFTAGSIPIMGISNVARNLDIEFVVAVLHATTISLQPICTSILVFLMLNAVISSGDLSP
jgi:hypothetical protein